MKKTPKDLTDKKRSPKKADILPTEYFNDKRVLNTDEACAYLNHYVSGTRLKQFRSTMDPEGPPFMLVGRTVRYRKVDLDRWLESKVVDPRKAAS